MKFAPGSIVLVVTLLFCLCVSPSGAELPVRRIRKKAFITAVDPDYAAALAAANRFLHAWQSRDQEVGLSMLSNEARHQTSVDQLQAFFSPSADAAFEISHGRKRDIGSYAFPVTLFDGTGQHRHRGEVVVRKLARDDWAVDRIP